MKNEIYLMLSSTEFTQTLDWHQICNTINKFPKEHIEMIYVLIIHHFFLESSMKANQPVDLTMSSLMTDRGRTKSKSLPYGGKTFENGKGAIYTVEKIPDGLKRVISAYVHIVTEQ